MTEGVTAEDRALIEQVRTVLDEVDPVPQHVIEAALGSYAWRTIDAELARLVADTADTHAVAGVRGGADANTQHARLVTFEAAGVTVEVEVAQTGDRRRLMGQLVPPSAADVQILTPGSERTVRADDLGRFSADDIPAGPLGLAITIAGAPKVIASAWITI